MSIGIETFANANISIEPSAVSLNDFGTLAFIDWPGYVQNSADPLELATTYNSYKEMEVDYAASKLFATTLKAGRAFYSQTPTPKKFIAIRYFNGAGTFIATVARAWDEGVRFQALAVGKTLRDRTRTETFSNWCESNSIIFMNTSNSSHCLRTYTSSSSDYASRFKRAGRRFTMTIYCSDLDQYPCCAAFGRAASVNFEGIASTITLNLKSLPDISAEDISLTQLSNLRARNCSAVIDIGDNTTALTNSKMANGSWLDTAHGLVWLKNKIGVDMFNFMYAENTKVPYSQVGINMTKAVLQKSLETAIRNGFIAPGYLADGTFLSTGYRVYAEPLDTTSASDKSNRMYRGLSFSCTGAGALHEFQVNGTFSE